MPTPSSDYLPTHAILEARAVEAKPIVLPADCDPLNASFERSGDDLVIAKPDSPALVILDYFAAERLADLVTDSGAVVKGRTIDALSRPAPDGAADEAANPEIAIGFVDSLLGNVIIIRADGTRVQAVERTAVFEGDVIETGADAAVGLRFVDGMSMSLGANARMVLEDFRYDPDTGDGGGLIEVVQGLFSFISGKAAKAGLDALVIETPTMDIGVRGTKVVAHASAEGEVTTVTLLPEDDGTIGKIMIKTDAGEELLDQPFMSTIVTSRFLPPLLPVFVEPKHIFEKFGETLEYLPSDNDERGSLDEFRIDRFNFGDRGYEHDARNDRSAFVESELPVVKDHLGHEITSLSNPDTSVDIEKSEQTVSVGRGAEASIAIDTFDPELDWIEEVAIEDAGPLGAAPQIIMPVADTGAIEDAAFSYDVAASFTDPDGDALTFSATQAGGAPLPVWISIDGATGVLSGTPDNSDVGSLLVNVTATDTGGLANSSAFQLTIANTNDAPTVSVAIADTATAEDAAFSHDASLNLTDVDAPHGDSLTFSATQVGGAPLPAWLSMDAVTGVLSGTPAQGDVGIIDVEVTLTDSGGLSASSAFQLTVTNVNDRPVVSFAIADTGTSEDAAFNYDVAGSFTDPDGDALTFSATQVGGAPLPAWLSIDAVTGNLSGTPAQGDVGSLLVNVTATDTGGLTNSSAFQLTISNTNDAPTVAVAIADMPTAEDAAFSYDASVNFVDVDAPHGDSLTFSSTQVGGAPLPGWLNIDAVTGVFSGTPSQGDVGVIDIEVTATDSGGLSVNNAFQLTISNTNDAPTVSVAIADTGASEDAAFSYDVSGSFADVDIAHGDSLTFSAMQVGGAPLPVWISIDPVTGVLSGTPDNDDVGALNIEVAATDGGGLTATSAFQLTISNTNDAPTVSAAIADTGASEDAAFSYDVSGSFADVDIAHGDSLTFSATQVGGAPLPGWISIDPVSGVLSGTPGNADVGALNIEVVATDGGGLTAMSAFQLAIANTNDAPTVSVAIADTGAAEDAAFIYDVSSGFADVDIPHGDSLTFSATQAGGAPLPGWISIDPVSGVLSGTPGNADVGALNIEVVATDGGGVEVSDAFQLTISNTNDGPVVTVPFSAATPPQDALYSLNTAPHFADDDTVHGDSLTFNAQQVGGVPLPGWLSIDPVTGVLSGTPTATDVGIPLDVEVTATDGSAASVQATFLLTVSNVNDSPVVSAAIADTGASEDVAFSYNMSANLVDPDGDALTFTAQRVGGAPLPGWLSIDPVTGILSGTPAQGDVGVIDVEVTVTDPSLLSATSSFQLTISNTNDAPTVSVAIADTSATQDAAFNYDVSGGFADADIAHGDSLTYSATQVGGAPLPAWISIDPVTAVLSGMPDNDDVGTLDIDVTATDGSGLTATSAFQLTISNTNDAPTVSVAIADTSATQDAAFNYDVSGGFADADIAHGDSLTYSATQVGGAPLPAWISIDPVTGVLSGTPDNDDVGTLDIDVTATDGSGLTATSAFQLIIANVNDAPTVSIAIAATAATEDAAFTYDVSAGFADADIAHGDSLTYSATQVGGAPLPAWISIDPVTGVLSGTPGNDDTGMLDIEVTATDGGGLTANSAFQLAIVNVNDAPVLTVTASPEMSEVTPDATDPAGNTIAEIIVDGSIVDGDGSALEAIALTGVEAANGTWEYSLNDGGAWSAVGAVSDAGALLLDATARVRFVPNADYSGSATFTFRAWDQSTGASGDSGVDVTSNGGDTPFSAEFDTASVSVSEPTANVVFVEGVSSQVNTETLDSQDNPAVAGFATGGYIVVWQSKDQDGDYKGVFGQRYDANGQAVGGEFQVNTETSNNQEKPTVATFADGGFVVAWQSKDQDGDLNGVYVQRYNVSNNPVGGETLVNTWTTGEQKEAHVTALPDGGFVVVWESKDQDGSWNGVYGQRYDFAGNTVGSEFLVNTYTADEQKNATVSALEDGGFVVVWELTDQDGDWNGVYGQRYDSAGNTVGSEFLVNTYTADEQKNATVSALEDGGFVVVWESTDQDGDWNGVYGQRYDSAGNPVGSEFLVNTYTADEQKNATVSALEDGGFVVVWESTDQDGDRKGVYGQRYDSAGNPVGSEFLVNTYTADDQDTPVVAGLSNGGFVVVWESKDQDGSYEGVFQQIFDANGNAVDADFSVNATSSNYQQDNAIAALDGGGFVVVWQSEGTGNVLKDICAQRYDAAGAAVGAEFKVNATTSSNQTEPVATGLVGGGFVVTWSSNGQDGNKNGVFAQRFDASGNAVGGDIQVNTYTSRDQQTSEITALADGGFLVVWQSDNQDGDDWGIYGRRFDSAGNPVTAEFAVNNTGARAQTNAAVAELADGTIVVTWQSDNGTVFGEGICMRRFATDGTPVSNESLVNSYTSGDQTNPEIAVLEGGGFVITWMSEDQDGSDTGIYAQRYNAAGEKQEFEFQVNTTTAGAQQNSRIIALEDGGFIVAWESVSQDFRR